MDVELFTQYTLGQKAGLLADPGQCGKAFAFACGAGMLDLAQEIAVWADDEWFEPALYRAAEGGRDEVVLWLIAVTSFTRDAAGRAVSAAYGSGHHSLGGELADRLRVYPTDFRAFRDACGRGFLTSAVAFDRRWEVPVAFAQDSALQHACAGGHVRVAEWIMDRFATPPWQLTADDYRITLRAAQGGHLPMLLFLDQQGARCNCRHCPHIGPLLAAAAGQGDLETLRWLVESRNLGPTARDPTLRLHPDAVKAHGVALRAACAKGEADAAEYLFRALGPILREEDRESAVDASLQGHHLGLARWVAVVYRKRNNNSSASD